MARIIRTIPTPRKKLSLRVVLSLLLFLQIQIPNAKDVAPSPSGNAFNNQNLSDQHSSNLALAKPVPVKEVLINPAKTN